MSNKSIIYSYREGDKKRGKLLFTDDKTLKKNYPKSFGISKSAMGQKFKILPKAETLDSKSKVIIVGNSPNVLKNEYGSLIDSYDTVIRINKCVTKNYEKYVGSKIDIWATTHNSAKWYGEDYIPDNYKNITQIWKRTPKTTLSSLPECLQSISSLQMFKSNFYRSKENEKVKTYIDESEFISEPCTGLLTILTATTFYKNVSIYGFSFFNESNNLVRDYYAFNKHSINETELKNYEKEKEKNKNFFKKKQNQKKEKLIQRLSKEKIINII